VALRAVGTCRDPAGPAEPYGVGAGQGHGESDGCASRRHRRWHPLTSCEESNTPVKSAGHRTDRPGHRTDRPGRRAVLDGAPLVGFGPVGGRCSGRGYGWAPPMPPDLSRYGIEAPRSGSPLDRPPSLPRPPDGIASRVAGRRRPYPIMNVALTVTTVHTAPPGEPRGRRARSSVPAVTSTTPSAEPVLRPAPTSFTAHPHGAWAVRIGTRTAPRLGGSIRRPVPAPRRSRRSPMAGRPVPPPQPRRPGSPWRARA
jgi:hypothetical protein